MKLEDGKELREYPLGDYHRFAAAFSKRNSSINNNSTNDNINTINIPGIFLNKLKLSTQQKTQK